MSVLDFTKVGYRGYRRAGYAPFFGIFSAVLWFAAIDQLKRDLPVICKQHNANAERINLICRIRVKVTQRRLLRSS